MAQLSQAKALSERINSRMREVLSAAQRNIKTRISMNSPEESYSNSTLSSKNDLLAESVAIYDKLADMRAKLRFAVQKAQVESGISNLLAQHASLLEKIKANETVLNSVSIDYDFFINETPSIKSKIDQELQIMKGSQNSNMEGCKVYSINALGRSNVSQLEKENLELENKANAILDEIAELNAQTKLDINFSFADIAKVDAKDSKVKTTLIYPA